jgi:hypothetical protein
LTSSAKKPYRNRSLKLTLPLYCESWFDGLSAPSKSLPNNNSEATRTEDSPTVHTPVKCLTFI